MAPLALSFISLIWCCLVSYSPVYSIPLSSQTEDGFRDISGSFVEASNEFAVALYKKLATSERNVFFCPVCVYSSLAMLAEVTDGKTRSELNETLRMKPNRIKVDEARSNFSELNSRMKETSCLSGMANGLFVDDSCLDVFNSTSELQDVYSTVVLGVDFRGNSQQAAWDMNEFVKSGTGSNIRRVFDRVDDSTADPSSGPPLMLLNTFHFAADIGQPPSVNQSGIRSSGRVKRTFFNHGVGDHDLNVPAIDSRHQKVRIAESYDFRALEVPCVKDNSSDVSIWIFLSHKLGRLSDVEYGLSTDTFREVEASFRDVVTDISIPRIKFGFQAEITKDLQDLGLVRIFDSDLAEFQNVPVTEKGLRLNKVLHRASVDIGEQSSGSQSWTSRSNVGTASSEIWNETSSTSSDSPEGTSTSTSSSTSSSSELPPFKADHPFLFFVMEKKSGIILYMGRLYEF